MVSGNTLASDSKGPDSITGRGTLVGDSSFNPLGVGNLSTGFCWELKFQSSHEMVRNVHVCSWRYLIQKMHTSFCLWCGNNKAVLHI